MAWDPRHDSTKDANVGLIHAHRYNKVTRGLSILHQRSLEP